MIKETWNNRTSNDDLWHETVNRKLYLQLTKPKTDTVQHGEAHAEIRGFLWSLCTA